MRHCHQQVAVMSHVSRQHRHLVLTVICCFQLSPEMVVKSRIILQNIEEKKAY